MDAYHPREAYSTEGREPSHLPPDFRLVRLSLETLLVARSEEVASDFGPGSPHTLIVPIFDGGSADITLPPLDPDAVKELLEGAEPPVSGADEIGRIARLSLLAARRRIAIKPELLRPYWAKAPAPRLVRRAVLAGRWNENAPGDYAALGSLLGAPYDSQTDELATLRSGGDPLVVRVGATVGLVSHVDAWLQLSEQLRKDDLAVFRKITLEVLSEVDPVLDLDLEDRWRAPILGKERAYSSELRAGLASTLALLGARGDALVDGTELTGREWAASTVRQLLESANADTTCRLWISLVDVLPLLAEAAPSDFLDGVRAGLVAQPPLLGGMFRDNANRSSLFPDSPHTSLLWALETCAWSPTAFGQAVDLLARLVEIDPGGSLVNRPAASLREIFRPGYPQNSVSPARRLDVLGGLRDRHQSVAWNLMISMLPEQQEIALATHEPRFRDWKPKQNHVTLQEYLSVVDEICGRLLQDAGLDTTRWKQIIEKLADLPPSARTNIFQQLDRITSEGGLDAEARGEIWESLRSTAALHWEFNEAAWALPSDQVARIEELARRVEPISPTVRYGWLFEGHMPEIPGVQHVDWNVYSTALAEMRAQAARDIADSLDWSRLRDYAVGTQLPWHLGFALAQAGAIYFEEEILGLLKSDFSLDVQFARGYATKRFSSEGWRWIESLQKTRQLAATQVAWLLLDTGDFPRAWEVAERAGSDIAAEFWSRFGSTGYGADFAYVNLAAGKLLWVGRPAASLDLLALYSRGEPDDERAELMAAGLEKLLQPDQAEREGRLLSESDLRSILSYIERSSLSRERLARLEWAFLPAFGYRASPPTLSQMLARDAAMFTDVVCRVYRPEESDDVDDEATAGGEVVQATEEQGEMAAIAYRLLSQWRAVPGQQGDGTVDREALLDWVTDARRRLGDAHRLRVGDIHIGHVIASSPPDKDGSWPSAAIRDLLEVTQSRDMEDGLVTQIYNTRGPTWRGLLDGGEQERALAAKYREQAKGFADRWPRTAAVLNSVADGYEREARRHDGEAERRRRGLDS